MKEPTRQPPSSGDEADPMLPRGWRELRQLLDAVLDAPVEQRSEMLVHVSAGDAQRRQELSDLVAACEQDLAVVSRPAADRFSHLLDQEAEPRLPETLGGRYRIERELGRGGMARVYLALDTKHGREVAVKVVRPDIAASLGRERFLREIAIAARLRHPNIVPLYDSGDADGVLYFVMPYEEGLSLRTRLRQDQPLSVGECVGILRDVARALAYAHERGVVHRDVKPDNVMLSGGAAVVTDFGIAKAVSAAQGDAPSGTLTQAGAGIGTPEYMAPEQAIGDPTTDHRADIYSFGCLAYEVFSGKPPFHDRPTHEIIAAHVGITPVPLAGVCPGAPNGIAHLVDRCLAKAPAARPQSAQDLVAELEASQTVAAMTPQPHRGRLASIWPALLLTSAVVLGGVGFVVARGRPRPASVELRLAVLPLRPLGGESVQSDMADGLSDEVATALFNVPGVRVMSRGAVYKYRGVRDIDPRRVGQELGVRLLVMGALRGTGNRFTVTASLVDAEDANPLWADVFERTDGDYTAVREDIVRAIERTLQTRFGTPVRAPATGRAAVRAVNREAGLYYMKGQGSLTRRQQSVREAVESFRRAVQIDSLYAPAYSGLSLALALTPYFQPISTKEVAAEATAMAERALRLDSTLAQPHVALGLVHQHAYDWERASAELQTALRLRSEDDVEPLIQYGRHLLFRGRVDEALAQLLEARTYEPASAVVASWVAYAYYAKDQLDSAGVEIDRALQADSNNVTTLMTGSLVRLKAGRPEEARRLTARLRRVNMPSWSFYVLAATGDTATLRLRSAELAGTTGQVWLAETARALMFLGLGDTTQAMTALERATDAGEHWPSLVSAVSDPMFDGLQGSARYHAILRRVGLGGR